MRKKICFFIHTEYHLLLSIHYIQQNYSDVDAYEVIIVLKRKAKGVRLKQDLNFNMLPYEIRYLDVSTDLNAKLTKGEKINLESILSLDLTEFNFFQEQDPLAIIFINAFRQKGATINLFQDGFKPYIAHTMSFSPSLLLNNIKQNVWIKKNGYPVTDYLSFINCRQYGFIKGIDRLFLTFPDAYINWNKLPISIIAPEFSGEYTMLIKQIFNWKESLLQERERVIFFMNQPMHDDASFEVTVLKQLQTKYPEATIYIKNHPLTSEVKLKAYASLKQVKIIDSKIPAELFISQLKNSIILSVFSTSMFMNNPSCKFYYIFTIQEHNNIERLKKYAVINPTKHVISVKNVDAIEF